MGVTSILKHRNKRPVSAVYSYVRGDHNSKFLKDEGFAAWDYTLDKWFHRLDGRKEFLHPGEVKKRVFTVDMGVVDVEVDCSRLFVGLI